MLDGYFPGLSYLDTSRGIAPIVEKLSFPLQDKWTMVGSKFKEDNKVTFPPFWFFSGFVRKEAKARNDPSFLTASHYSSTQKKEGPSRFFSSKQSVMVHKTGVFTKAEKSVEDLGKMCPMHHKPHPLRKCKGFRYMLLEDRKKFIRENNICYRCLASSTHQAKNCEIAIKCLECGSERHLSALHPGPPAQSATTSCPPKEHGGEEEDKEKSDVTTMCTKVCGGSLSGKSCSKVCLVKVFPQDQQHNTKKMYAILDEQSNVSLVRAEFFDMFNVDNTPEPYTLKTCAGVMETPGRRAHGFIVESIDEKICLSLPTLIECSSIPCNRTPEAAWHHQHLRPIAKQIPPLDPDAEILLLIGRDLLFTR